MARNAKYIVTEDSHYDVLQGLDFPKVDIIKLDDIIQKLSTQGVWNDVLRPCPND